jgi:hypothetical protein
MNEPIEHSMQSVEPLPDAYFPTVQAKQDVDPFDAPNIPAAQGKHSPTMAAPTAVPYSPRSQTVQVPESAIPTPL